jgi:hypothetical protein
MKTVNMETDLEVGERHQREWRTVMVRLFRCCKFKLDG